MKNILELERVIHQGAEAARIYSGLEKILVNLQQRMLADMTMAVSKNEDVTIPAMKVAVLDMVVEDLLMCIDTGHRAARKKEERLDG